MKKYIYHVSCQFMKANKFPVEITYWDFIFNAVAKIDGDNYEAVKKEIWDKAGDDVHSRYTINNMMILSLSFLHEAEK